MITEMEAHEAHDLVKRDYLIGKKEWEPSAQIACAISLTVLCWVIGCDAPDCPPRFDLMLANIKDRPRVAAEMLKRMNAKLN